MENKNEVFQMLLNAAPDNKKLKTHQGVKYLPIGEVERTLDYLYAGQWKISNISIVPTYNSLLCTLTLSVLHPVTNNWISRSGAGASPLATNKDNGKRLPLTHDNIQTFAIQKAAPAAKSFALKNAAASLGVVFGRDINRDIDDWQFVDVSEKENEINRKKEQESATLTAINQCVNLDALTELYNKVGVKNMTPKVYKAFANQGKIIKTNNNG